MLKLSNPLRQIAQIMSPNVTQNAHFVIDLRRYFGPFKRVRGTGRRIGRRQTEIFLGRRGECRLATGRAEVIRRPLVDRHMLKIAGLHFHSADRVD